MPDDELLAPYMFQLGCAVDGWNTLHEALAMLFHVILYPQASVKSSIPYAIWYSTQSDRTQREMLRAAALARFTDKETKFPHARDDIVWLLNEANTLSDKRNNAVHSPLTISRRWEYSKPVETKVVAQDFFGHPRASRLRNKDILDEYQWATECADVLGLFASKLTRPLTDESESWPDRPLLPNRGDKKPHPPGPRRPHKTE